MRAPYRSVVVTGGSSGLGADLARAYAAPGVTLGLVGRDRDRLAAVAAACAGSGAVVESAALDVAEPDPLAAWLLAFDRVHPVDLLVANAGISAGSPVGSVSEGVETAARQVRTNLLGAINTIEPLLPALCARRRGRIAVIASVAALRGLPYSPGYCASKAGLRAYAEAMRPRLAPHGVGVTVICPGFFASRMTDRWEGPTPFLVDAAAAARRVKRAIDRGRSRADFPWPLAFGMRFCDLAPAWLGDAILRRFVFTIRPT